MSARSIALAARAGAAAQVAACVTFVHYAERLYEAATASPAAHPAEHRAE